MKPQVTAKDQMVEALNGKVQVVAMNPAVRLKDQMLKVAPALQNLMMKFWPKQPHS